MAKERHPDAAVNLSHVTREANGSPSDAVAQTAPEMALAPKDPPAAAPPQAEAASCSSEGPVGMALPLLSAKSKSPSPTSSSSDSDLKEDMDDAEALLRPLSGAKRCLWPVDRKQVDESLSKELKKTWQDESFIKSSKWNFDFQRDAPLSGDWHWEPAKEAPHFYAPKNCPGKKKLSHSRFSPYDRPAAGSRSKVSSSSSPHSSALVTSAVSSSQVAQSASSSQSPSLPPPDSSSAVPQTKDCLRLSAQVSSESSEKVLGSSIVQDTGGKEVSSTTVVSTCTTTMTSVTCTATSSSTSTVSQTSESCPRIPAGDAPSSVPRGLKTSSPSQPEVDDKGGSSSGPRPSSRPCKPPDKKKLRTSKNSSSGSSSSSTSGGGKTSPSSLLMHYR